MRHHMPVVLRLEILEDINVVGTGLAIQCSEKLKKIRKVSEREQPQSNLRPRE